MRFPWSRSLGAKRYDQVVSLGRGCQPAHQIRRILNLTRAQVFDWILTTDRGLVTLIGADLDGFFARDRLGVGPNGRITDLQTDTQFVHEFPAGADFDAHHARHAGRFAMLVRRWRKLLASKKRVLFVRQHGWDPDPRAAAVELRDAIRRRAPRLRFSLLYLTAPEFEDTPWGEEGISNRRLTQPEPYDWKGDDAVWERLLKEALDETDPM